MSGWSNPERPPESVGRLRQELLAARGEIQELLVVIDTAQTALRRAENCVPDEHKHYVFNRSAKWVLDWKQSCNEGKKH